jgi:hypothetical protein
VVSLVPTRASATPLAPGATYLTPNDAGVFDPGLLLDSIISPFVTNTGTLSGTLRTSVYRNATGMLDFYYQVTNNPAVFNGGNAISGVSGLNFTGALVNASYRTDAFGVFTASTDTPVTVSRTSNGSEVIFWFGPPWTGVNKILPGQTSSVLMIASNALTYTTGQATIQNHGMAWVTAFQPATIPEPGTIGMALVGLVGLVAYRRRQE